MDVTSDEQIDAVFSRDLSTRAGTELDIILHSIGFAPNDQMSGPIISRRSTAKDHEIAHDISSYSFPALAKAGRSMLSRQ